VRRRKKKIWFNLSLGMFWNLTKMIVTFKLKTQLSFLKIHVLLLLVELLIIRSDMLYDNALDDGPILIDNSSCTNEDKIDELVGCDDAVIHESPILFLKSPIYTNEDKYVMLRSTYVVCNFLMKTLIVAMIL
jgi:hypothetical protein